METQNYQFSYIIAYKHTQDRLPLLRKTIAWLHQIKGAEIIIVEQDKIQKLEETDHRARHYIFLKNEGQFEKTWAFNVGAKYATTNTLVFGDADLIMNTTEFQKSLQEFKTKNYDVLSPHSQVLDLTAQENNLPLNKLYEIKRQGRKTELLPGNTTHQNVSLCGGITIWKREALDKVNSWPEEFIGWGCEDNAQSEKVLKLGLKNKTMDYKAYHLYHKRVAPNENQYLRNLNLLKQVQGMTDQQMLQWINQKRGKIGHLNKYA